MVINIPDNLKKSLLNNNVLWGKQTQSALKFFCVSSEKMPWELIISLAHIKRAAAKVNFDLKLLDHNKCRAIIQAADEILSGNHKSEFPLSIWQSGSGTQSNMNINEVLANRANELLQKEQKNITNKIHPNDHVNKSQSSNDVFPSAMHISAVIGLNEKLLPCIKILQKTLLKKSIEFRNIIKIGRTHLQDAIPLTLGQEISGWEFMLKNNFDHISSNIPYLCELSLGGTATGTGFNTHLEYAERVVRELSKEINYSFVSTPNRFESLATCDALVRSHGSLKGLAVSIMKIANDIRLLASGPRCGVGELKIPENEPGSSIMPGKINPTQCESMMMICCQVIGNDAAITMGGSSGNFELNTYRPLIIHNFLQSVRLLSDGIKNFHNYCIIGIQPQLKRIKTFLNKSLMLVTALSSHIGYDKATHIAKKAYSEGLSLKAAATLSGYVSEQQFETWVQPKNMIGPFSEEK